MRFPELSHERADDGSLRCRSREALAPHHPSLARLFRAAVERRPDGLFLAERERRQLAQADLPRGAADRGWARAKSARARTVSRAPDHDLVRQQHRSCAAHACRPHRRHSGSADLGRLFPAEPGPRQAQAHRRIARARPRLCRRHRPLCQSPCGPRPHAGRAGREPQWRRPRRRHRPGRHGAKPAGRGLGRSRRGHRRGHHRQDPVHLGVDRPAQRRDQHPWHADREPAAARADLAVSR